jgi:hypothetical protein
MIMLSEFFSYEDMTHSVTALRKRLDNTPNADQLNAIKATCKAMDEVRRLLGRPILITSGFRCKKVNEAVGGTAKSAHVKGHAVDFVSPAFGPVAAIFGKLKGSGIVFDQLIMEFPASHSGGWVHLSFAPEARRQCLSFDGAFRVA